MRVLVFLIGLLSSFSLFGQSDQLFEQGKQDYRDQQFVEALDNWKKILQQGEHSAALYFNMGNAHYKLNQVGLSIFYYEKALQLDPTNADVLNNLSYAQNATVDEIEPLPRTLFQRWFDDLSGQLSLKGWSVLTLILAFACGLLFILYYFGSRERQKRILFGGSLVSLGLTIFSLVICFMIEARQSKDSPAIIVAERAKIQSEPNFGSEESFILHEGTKVRILDQEGDWLRIQIADGKDGWLIDNTVKRL